jgi:hypothetical protein
MKAYIDVKQAKAGYYAEVVDEQDYKEGGPFAHSYRTPTMKDSGKARDSAKEWAEERGLRIVASDEI